MPQTMEEIRQEVSQDFERINTQRPKRISTKTHGILDYTLSPTLAFAPSVFGFPSKGAASSVPRAYGAASMVYSTLTRYEMGIYPVMSMRTHLIIDAVSSVFMAASPWLFGFARRHKKRTWLPHLAFAVAEMAIVAMSDDRSKL